MSKAGPRLESRFLQPPRLLRGARKLVRRVRVLAPVPAFVYGNVVNTLVTEETNQPAPHLLSQGRVVCLLPASLLASTGSAYSSAAPASSLSLSKQRSSRFCMSPMGWITNCSSSATAAVLV